ncbi:MAG: barstar family protein [Acidobacteria bacterium]|nr:barstar family protein [Acidobacteriota bacterium]
MGKRIYEVDGRDSTTFEEFAADFTERLSLEIDWGGNLDAFNDILHGGFGTPEEGFVLVWKNSALSKERLGYPETIKWLEERMRRCHPLSVEHLRQRLALARQEKGETLFDTLVGIITDKDHRGIELRLE